jgi:hypothetical protein
MPDLHLRLVSLDTKDFALQSESCESYRILLNCSWGISVPFDLECGHTGTRRVSRACCVARFLGFLVRTLPAVFPLYAAHAATSW